MTPEEIQRALAYDTAWHDIDIILAIVFGVMLGGTIFGVLGYVLRGMEERFLKKEAARRAGPTEKPPGPSACSAPEGLRSR